MSLYRALLRLYPASFRDEYGRELRAVFEAERRDAVRLASRLGLYHRTAADLLANALKVRSGKPLRSLAPFGT